MRIANLKTIRDWFFNVDIANFGDPTENMVLSRMLPRGFEEEAVQKNIVKYFSTFDASITGFKVH